MKPNAYISEPLDILQELLSLSPTAITPSDQAEYRDRELAYRNARRELEIVQMRLFRKIRESRAALDSKADSVDTFRGTSQSPKLLFSRAEAAEILNIHVNTIDAAIRQAKLKPARKGRRVLIHRDELQRFARRDAPDLRTHKRKGPTLVATSDQAKAKSPSAAAEEKQ